MIEHTAGLPLALALAGAQVADGLSGATLARQLRAGRIEFLDHPYGSVYDSLGRSLDKLSAEERERYLELAVFPEDVVIPVQVVARLWQHSAKLNAAEAEKLLARLDRKALLTLTGTGAQRTVALHDLQHDFIRLRAENLPALHARLLEAYRSTLALPAGAEGWASLPADEPYLWQHLAAHLAAAGRADELEGILLDRDWIEARLAAATRTIDGRTMTDVAAVIADFEATPAGSPCRWVGRALRASAHVLRTRPEMLDQQLFGRLGVSRTSALRTLAEQARSAIEESEVWRPTLAALAAPGALTAVFAGHTAEVIGALLLPDGQRVLSWSNDATLRLWDLEEGGEPRVLAGHEGEVWGALLPDGRRALSWAVDRTLGLWDLAQGGEPHVLRGHEDKVTGALLLSNGWRVLSCSEDRTLRL